MVKTMEWDTAAGYYIVENVEGRVVSLKGSSLMYNKKDLLNEGFFCLSGAEEIWTKIESFILK